METKTFVRVYLIIAAVAIGSALVEGVVLSFTGKRDYDWKGSTVSLVIAVGRRLTDFVPALLALPGAAWLYEHRIFTWDMREALSWVVLFLSLEFAYYWFHRASHRVRWFWANHAVHHSPNQFNLSAAYRLGWLGKITFTLIFFSPLAWIGFAPQVILLAFAINLLYQFWIHTRAVSRLGPLEWVMNTPSHHRVHHGINPRYIDKNHAGIFIIWDRLLGTFIEEDSEPVYGTVKPLASFNPVWANFAELQRLWQISRTTRLWRDKIWIWFAPPEWHPQDCGGVVIVPEITREEQQKYRVSPPLSVGIYTTVSFVGLLLAGTFLLYISHQLTMPLHLLYIAQLVVGLATVGALSEGKPWARPLELCRFASLFGSLALLPQPYQMALFLGFALHAVLFVLLVGRRAQSLQPASSL